MICGNHAAGLVFSNMAERKMIQMIPEHPDTPLLQLNGERGFVFCDLDERTATSEIEAKPERKSTKSRTSRRPLNAKPPADLVLSFQMLILLKSDFSL
jgi:hypothetical protein